MKLVRITNIEQREVATDLWFRIFPDEPYWIKKYVINKLYDPRNRRQKPGQPYFVAYHRNKPVGLSGFYKEKTGEYWLGWFGVLSKYQNQGLGSKILDATINELKASHPNVNYFYLWTEGSRAVQNFYRKNGFKYFGELHVWATDAKIFRKAI